MTLERWERIKELFEAALDCQGSDRSVFLERACEGDEDMRSELERLLAAHDQGVSLLEHPPFGSEQILERADTDLIGQRIGRYSIRALIGKGGMGAVYRAVREDDFRMEVAIKLLKRGTDTEAALARFRFERQVLAGLQHPNIARLLDGGATADGLPYLVMEYVDGTLLLQYATPLPLRERLELFRSVCSAVQYAHDKKVVHRDIKPANILVTSAGVPKLLDFGIAKLLDPEADGAVTLTSTGARLMTPNYASPEQVRGDPLTPATDIYSLGLVLFELVTGHQAHDVHTGSKERIDQIICTRDAKRPSAVAKNIPRDLDNIVLKALRKEPERRYASAADLSEDLDRFLHDLPVKARKESVVYSTLKFIKRKRALITAVALTAVLAGVTVTALGRIGVSRGSSGRSVMTRASGSTNGPDWDHWQFEKLAAVGDPAPGGGTYQKFFEQSCLNNRGDIAFSALVAGREAVFLLRKEEPAVQLARGGEPAPGGGTFDREIAGFTMNDSGDMVFGFGLNPLRPPELKGFMKHGLFRYSHAARSLTQIVIPGATVAPGFGVFLTTGQRPALNSAGDLVFQAAVPTPPGVSLTENIGAGVFLMDRNGRVTKLVVAGDPAPDGGRFDYFFNPWINDRGDVVFGAHVAGEECIGPVNGGCFESIYFRSAATGAIESIAHQGAHAATGLRYRYAWGALVNNRSDILFMGAIEAPLRGYGQTGGLFIHSSGDTVVVAIPDSSAPEERRVMTVNPFGNVGGYFLNNRGDVSFNAELDNGESAFYIYSQRRLHLVAGTGTVVPGIGTIASVGSHLGNGGALNDQGQIFFWATLTDGRSVQLLGTPRSPGSH